MALLLVTVKVWNLQWKTLVLYSDVILVHVIHSFVHKWLISEAAMFDVEYARWEIYGSNCFMWYNDYQFYSNGSTLVSGESFGTCLHF